MKTDKQRDSYYRRRYGVSADEHDERGKDGCEICGSKGKKRGLHADHAPSIRNVKITVRREGSDYIATACNRRVIGISRKDARATMSELLKTLSYRGATCFHCNLGLRWFRNNPEYLNAAALYLLAYKNKVEKP